MQCPMQNNEAAGFLLDYCARKLDPGKTAVIESHLRICESCRELVRAQRAVWESLEAWEEIEVAPGFNRQLYARIDADSQRSLVSRWMGTAVARWSPLSWRPALPIALACVTVIAALWIQEPGSRKLETEEPQAKVERVDIEQVERTLQDLDMLKQLSPKISPEANSSSSI
jgi:anti-sigma factor ChrR (cupin superfamily)